MIVVIIAGGSGTRLWPLSTPEYPKHLLKINGDERSLVQRTYERAKLLTDKIYVVTEKGQLHHIKKQLSELKDEVFIAEPARRGTASCILAALTRITDKDGPIVFLAADHYVRDSKGFAHSFKLAAETSEKYGRIVLVGAEPDYPATGFGYIQKDGLLDEDSFIFNVHSFKEKPDHDTALKYLASGNYLWNCGYFVGSVNTFEKAMKTFAPRLFKSYQELLTATPTAHEQVYLGLENISIDYALIENTKDLLVVPASFDWLDLGSYSELHKAVGSDKQGNNIYGKVLTEEVENSYIYNDETKPVAVIGLDNIAVVNAPNGLLVTRKDLAQKVGELSKRFNSQK